MNYEKIDIVKFSNDLKSHVSQFEPISFLTHLYYYLNTHTRTHHKILKIESPLMQIRYLIALYMSSGCKGTKVFDPVTGKFGMIEELLTEIERGYRYNFTDEFPDIDFDTFPVELEVSNATYLNFFVNGPLNYIEQELARFREIFIPFNSFILERCGLSVEDFIEFYLVTERMDDIKLKHALENTHSNKSYELLIEHENDANSDAFFDLVSHVEKGIYNVCFRYEDFLFFLPEEKVKLWLELFECNSINPEFLYYTEQNPLGEKPLINIKSDLYLFYCQKQLLTAMHNYLIQLCKNIDNSGQKINKLKDKQLEKKTKEVFGDFFESATICENYMLHGNEKDLLILYRNTAFVVECKAHAYREPLRDVTKGFQRIKDDFKVCIQKGFDQALPVERLFRGKSSFTIFDSKTKSDIIINPNKYDSVYSIIVTASRLGHIQCDLDLLLDVPDDLPFPWSVYIDDLETFLITLKRRDSFYGDILTYLKARQKLHGRMNAFDELDICAHFLMEKDAFIKYCNQEGYYLPSPTLQRLFDDLYFTGFGFKDELHLDYKLSRKDPVIEELKKKLRLKTPKRIREYLKNNMTP